MTAAGFDVTVARTHCDAATERAEKLARWLDFQFGGPQVGNQLRSLVVDAIREQRGALALIEAQQAALDRVAALCDEQERSESALWKADGDTTHLLPVVYIASVRSALALSTDSRIEEPTVHGPDNCAACAATEAVEL